MSTENQSLQKSFEEICINSGLPTCETRDPFVTKTCVLKSDSYNCTDSLNFSGWAAVTGFFIFGLFALILLWKSIVD